MAAGNRRGTKTRSRRFQTTSAGQGGLERLRSVAGGAGSMEDELATVFAGGVIGDELAARGGRLVGEGAEHSAEVLAAGQCDRVAVARDHIERHFVAERN